MASNKLKYVAVVEIKDNKITGYNLDFNGTVEESVKSLISGLKKPLYAFVRERLIEPRLPGSAQVRVQVLFEERKSSRHLTFSIVP